MRTRLGRVEVTGGFLLLTAWLNYLDRQGVVPLALLACALHELGHWAALRALGARVRRVRLDRFLTAGLLLFGGLLVCFGGTATLFLTSCWLFSALCPEKEGKRGCHIRRKQVK